MSSGRAKQMRRAERLRDQLTGEQVRRNIRAMAAMKLIESTADLGGIGDEDKFPIILNSPERAIELALADPNIYKTPGGNLITVLNEFGEDDHYMSPAEAEACHVDVETIDREHPGATPA